jgi:transcriptional regulator with XRE-family HTH domain
VAASADVNRARFARFVARVLVDAHERGMSDDDIAAATGVGSSTFHRWQKGQFTRAPSIEKVRSFCVGLGVKPRVALLALGIEEGRDDPEPEPAIPDDPCCSRSE